MSVKAKSNVEELSIDGKKSIKELIDKNSGKQWQDEDVQYLLDIIGSLVERVSFTDSERFSNWKR